MGALGYRVEKQDPKDNHARRSLSPQNLRGELLAELLAPPGEEALILDMFVLCGSIASRCLTPLDLRRLVRMHTPSIYAHKTHTSKHAFLSSGAGTLYMFGDDILNSKLKACTFGLMNSADSFRALLQKSQQLRFRHTCACMHTAPAYMHGKHIYVTSSTTCTTDRQTDRRTLPSRCLLGMLAGTCTCPQRHRPSRQKDTQAAGLTDGPTDRQTREQSPT